MKAKSKKARAPKKTPAAIADKKKYYKVLLANGKSTHQGMCWSLPKKDKPGDWQRVEGELVLCRNGLHLTDAPAAWWAYGSKIYEVEYEDVGLADASDNMPKVVVRSARLLREITDANELATLGIFTSGEHKISRGMAHASGSATVTASGSATVTAYDSATVTAYDSATVTASGSATVTAYDSGDGSSDPT